MNLALVPSASSGFTNNVREDVSMHIVIVSTIAVGLVYLLWEIRP